MITETVKLVPTKVGHFYVWLAMAIALFAFAAFVPTYWLQLPAGTFVGTPLVHILTVIFSSWTLFLITQSYLAAKGRLKNHRAWGMAGIGLATSLVFFGTAVAIGSLRYRLTLPASGTARASFIVAMTNMVLFSGFFIAAMLNAKRSEIHRRLIFRHHLAAARCNVSHHLSVSQGFRAGVTSSSRAGSPCHQPACIASLGGGSVHFGRHAL